MIDIDRDADRGREYVEARWATATSAVQRLRYEVVGSDGEKLEEFTLWLEMSPATIGTRATETIPWPVVPIAFELEPRTFLRLRAERVIAPSQLRRRSDTVLLLGLQPEAEQGGELSGDNQYELKGPRD